MDSLFFFPLAADGGGTKFILIEMERNEERARGIYSEKCQFVFVRFSVTKIRNFLRVSADIYYVKKS